MTRDVSVKIANYKSIGESPQGFEVVLPINILIGRNNSGKTSLVEMFGYLTTNNYGFPTPVWNNGANSPYIEIKSKISEAQLRRIFPENRGGHPLGVTSHWQFGSRLIGKNFRVKLGNQNSLIESEVSLDAIQPEAQAGYGAQLANAVENPFKGKRLRRLFAERDVIPEPDNSALSMRGNGAGATNIIQNYLNKAPLDTSLIKRTFRSALNSIFEPDTSFIDIYCKQNPDNSQWEIYLEEENKGIIALSESGSGLKTIILILINILLIPRIEKTALTEYIFAFEEPENNLHPALLRKLLDYIRQQTLQAKFITLITTHSNVIIDQFSTEEDAQIIHVRTVDKKTRASRVKTYVENSGVLDDLDIRASDLLQSNGVIWVEGPSDRLYLNHWINLFSNGKFREGTHYQCMFYGGRLLAHLTATPTNSEWISLLKMNRNSAIVIDSDKSNRQARINDTKTRLSEEMDKIGGIAWITRGREIENYVSGAVVAKVLGLNSAKTESVGQYQKFAEYLDGLRHGEGDRFLQGKPLFAEKAVQFITEKSELKMLDLEAKINSLCDNIAKWNGLGR